MCFKAQSSCQCDVFCVDLLHDGMPYDPIQGQGHEPLKVGNSAIFEGYYLFLHLQWGLANDHRFLNYEAVPIAYRGRIFDLCPTFLRHVTLKSALTSSRPSVPYGANLICCSFIELPQSQLHKMGDRPVWEL